EHGFLQRESAGDLTDLISRRYAQRDVISVKPDDSLMIAYGALRCAEVSQLPVIEESGRAVGILDESDLLLKVHGDPAQFRPPVRSALSDKLETLQRSAKINDVIAGFERGHVVMLMDGDKFLGL